MVELSSSDFVWCCGGGIAILVMIYRFACAVVISVVAWKSKKVHAGFRLAYAYSKIIFFVHSS